MCPTFHHYLFQPRCLSFPSERHTGPCRPHPPRLSVCRGTVAPHSSWLRPAGSEGPDPSSDNNTLLFGRREVYTYVDSHELELLVSLCMVVWHQWNNIVIQSSTSFNTEIHNLLHRQSRSSDQFWKWTIPTLPIATSAVGVSDIVLVMLACSKWILTSAIKNSAILPTLGRCGAAEEAQSKN